MCNVIKMSPHYFSLACLLILYSVVLCVDGQSNDENVTGKKAEEVTQAEAISIIKKRLAYEQSRKTPTIAVANLLAKATCYIQSVEECSITGSTSFRTPDEVLKCIKQHIEEKKGPCAIKI